jgi:hypothetical protein
MGDINCFISIVKILENPRQRFFNNNSAIPITECRVQIPQIRNIKIIHLVCWGNLAREAKSYYKMNDYLIVEGFLSLPKKLNSKQVEITVLKIYPLFLNYENSVSKY